MFTPLFIGENFVAIEETSCSGVRKSFGAFFKSAIISINKTGVILEM
jgi:hypothetical protein